MGVPAETMVLAGSKTAISKSLKWVLAQKQVDHNGQQINRWDVGTEWDLTSTQESKLKKILHEHVTFTAYYQKVGAGL